jgi:hypothetical protein
MAIPSSGWLRVTSVSPEDAQVCSETTRPIEGMILQKTSEIGKVWLEHPEAGIRAELERE